MKVDWFNTTPKKREPTDNIDVFIFEGWYHKDLISEITYWERILSGEEESRDPFDGELIDYEDGYVQGRVDEWKNMLTRFEKAFEEQKPKTDYEDGTWV